jgi:hypothetical protein
MKNPSEPDKQPVYIPRVLVAVVAMLIGLVIITIIGIVTNAQSPDTEPSSSPTPTETVQVEDTAEPTEPAAPRPEPSSQRPAPPASPEPSPSETASEAETGTGYTVAEILAFIDALPVAPTVDNTGYERDLFGSGWLDPDGNGCDARNDILLRDLSDIVLDSDGCRVLSGTLNDSYTGETINFVRGQSTSSDVQIDHMIPLSRAWAMGANEWSEQTRRAFANDPINLFAVKGEANNNKSDQGIESWTPAVYDCILTVRAGGASAGEANRSCNANTALYDGQFYTAFECEYAARYIIVAYSYDLALTAGDIARTKSALELCA